MRILCLFVLILAAAPAFPEDPAPALNWSVEASVTPDYRVPAAWGVALGAGCSGLVLAGWGLGLFGSPGNQPWRVTAPALVWGTLLLCASGIAFDWLFNFP